MMTDLINQVEAIPTIEKERKIRESSCTGQIIYWNNENETKTFKQSTHN